MVPRQRCRGKDGTSHDSGQEQKPVSSRFPAGAEAYEKSSNKSGKMLAGKLWEKQLLHSCVSELRSPGHRGVGGHLCPS